MREAEEIKWWASAESKGLTKNSGCKHLHNRVEIIINKQNKWKAKIDGNNHSRSVVQIKISQIRWTKCEIQEKDERAVKDKLIIIKVDSCSEFTNYRAVAQNSG